MLTTHMASEKIEMDAMWSNPLPAANSSWLFCFQRLWGIRCSLVSSELASPAAAAEEGRWNFGCAGSPASLSFIVERRTIN